MGCYARISSLVTKRRSFAHNILCNPLTLNIVRYVRIAVMRGEKRRALDLSVLLCVCLVEPLFVIISVESFSRSGKDARVNVEVTDCPGVTKREKWPSGDIRTSGVTNYPTLLFIPRPEATKRQPRVVDLQASLYETKSFKLRRFVSRLPNCPCLAI